MSKIVMIKSGTCIDHILFSKKDLELLEYTVMTFVKIINIFERFCINIKKED